MKYTAIILMACFVFCSGCASYNSGLRTVQKQSNLASFLFSGNQPQAPAQKAPLQLPAKVGIAFVPGDPASSNLPDTTKKEVIEAVRSQLAKHTKYVAGAQSIPSIYLTPSGGVQNLEQVAQQFGVDVIVILGANQLQKHERNSLAAFLDVTIIGQYLIPGNTVDTATVLEAAVYHVPSRALIFRTDGANQKTSRSTRYGSSQTAQNDSASSILDASKKLVVSIGEALVGFEEFDAATAQEIQPLSTSAPNTVTEQKNYWDKANTYRSTGGGSFDLIWIGLTGAGLICAATIRRQH